MYPDMAGQITGMLLEMDNKELLHMQDSQDILKAKVEEAAAILQAHNAKEQGAVTKQKDAVTQLPSPGVRQDEVISEHELEALTADTLAAVSPQQQKRVSGTSPVQSPQLTFLSLLLFCSYSCFLCFSSFFVIVFVFSSC